MAPGPPIISRSAIAIGPSTRGQVRVEDKKMSDKIYEVPAEWKKRAYIDDAEYKEMYARAMKCFQEALEVEPRYSLARQALASLRRMVN